MPPFNVDHRYDITYYPTSLIVKLFETEHKVVEYLLKRSHHSTLSAEYFPSLVQDDYIIPEELYLLLHLSYLKEKKVIITILISNKFIKVCSVLQVIRPFLPCLCLLSNVRETLANILILWNRISFFLNVPSRSDARVHIVILQKRCLLYRLLQDLSLLSLVDHVFEHLLLPFIFICS